jgi:porin
MKRYCKFLTFLVVATATRLVAASLESDWQLIPKLDLAAAIDREFTKLTNIGITPFIDYYGVFQGNPAGGIQQRTAYSHLLLYGAGFNFDKLLGIPGGSLFLSGAEATGENLSGSIGNINTVSEAFATPLTVMFYEIYWKQMLLDDRLQLCLGRMSAADLFAAVPAFGLQVSGGINSNPTSLFVNAPFTSPPNATWAATAKINVAKQTYAEAGVYQASDLAAQTGYHGLNFAIKGEDGELVMAEVGWQPAFFKSPEKTAVAGNSGLPGTYIIGGYYSNFKFPMLNESKFQTNAYGFYTMAQQMLWRSAADPNTNFSVWGGLTYSPQQDISLLPLMGFAGTVWQGVIPRRNRDQFLLTYLISDFSRDYADAVAALGRNKPTAERVLETSYAIYLTDNYTIQPDIQYIIRPKGTNEVSNSLVLGIQFTANF